MWVVTLPSYIQTRSCPTKAVAGVDGGMRFTGHELRGHENEARPSHSTRPRSLPRAEHAPARARETASPPRYARFRRLRCRVLFARQLFFIHTFVASELLGSWVFSHAHAILPAEHALP